MKTELYKKQVKENVVAAMLDYMSEEEECGLSSSNEDVTEEWREW